MVGRRPQYWRAFWTTVGVVGAINAAFLGYYLSLPVQLLPRSHVLGRNVPDWALSMYVMNAPICLPTFAIASLTDHYPNTEPEMVRALVISQLLSTLFWGLMAIGVEGVSFTLHRAKRD